MEGSFPHGTFTSHTSFKNWYRREHGNPRYWTWRQLFFIYNVRKFIPRKYRFALWFWAV